MLPTFLIIGAPKSGTTAVYEYLRSHPQVCLATIRDSEYFYTERGVVDGGPPDGLAFSGNYQRGLTWYAQLFQPGPESMAIGELSRSYLAAEEAPRLVYQTLPACRLVFTLRDPVRRLYSHYWQERKIGWNLPDFETLVRTQHPRYRHYCATSAYQQHLERYRQYFSTGRMTILLFEDMVAAPAAFVRQLYQAIGVDPEFVPRKLGQRFNQPGLPRSKALQRLLVRLSDWRWKTGANGKLYTHLSRLGQIAMRWNSRSAPYPPLDPELLQQLRAEFEPSVAYVEAWLGRSLPEWRTA